MKLFIHRTGNKSFESDSGIIKCDHALGGKIVYDNKSSPFCFALLNDNTKVTLPSTPPKLRDYSANFKLRESFGKGSKIMCGVRKEFDRGPLPSPKRMGHAIASHCAISPKKPLSNTPSTSL